MLNDKIEQLINKAAELNTATEQLCVAYARIEHQLNIGGVRVEAWLDRDTQLLYSESHKEGSWLVIRGWALGYAWLETEQRWGLGVRRTEIQRQGGIKDITHDAVATPLAKADRRVHARAADLIEKLLEALYKATDKHLSEIMLPKSL